MPGTRILLHAWILVGLAACTAPHRGASWRAFTATPEQATAWLEPAAGVWIDHVGSGRRGTHVRFTVTGRRIVVETGLPRRYRAEFRPVGVQDPGRVMTVRAAPDRSDPPRSSGRRQYGAPPPFAGDTLLLTLIGSAGSDGVAQIRARFVRDGRRRSELRLERVSADGLTHPAHPAGSATHYLYRDWTTGAAGGTTTEAQRRARILAEIQRVMGAEGVCLTATKFEVGRGVSGSFESRQRWNRVFLIAALDPAPGLMYELRYDGPIIRPPGSFDFPVLASVVQRGARPVRTVGLRFYRVPTPPAFAPPTGTVRVWVFAIGNRSVADDDRGCDLGRLEP